MLYERYVVDTRDLTHRFKSSLRDILDSHHYDLREINIRIDSIYKESLSQMFMVLDNNINEYLLRIVGLPDISFFKHIEEFNDSQTFGRYHDIFKETALLLFHSVNSATNRTGSDVDYLLEAIGIDYVVIIKIYK